MRIQDVLDVLKPRVRTLMLFSILTFICIGGAIETQVFIDNVEKSPILNYIGNLDLLWPWILLSFPIHVLASILKLWWLLNYFPEIVPYVKLPIASIIYAYIVSCWVYYVWHRFICGKSNLKRIVITLSFTLPITQYIPSITSLIINLISRINVLSRLNLKFIIFVVSGYIFTAIVVFVYIVSIVGLLKLIKLFKH